MQRFCLLMTELTTATGEQSNLAPAAAALGRLGGLNSGKARAAIPVFPTAGVTVEF